MNLGDVRYISLPARQYAANGMGRFLNIVDYCRAVAGLASRVPGELAKPDAIIVTSPHPFAIYAARRLARRFDATLVFEARDLWSISMSEVNGVSRRHPFVVLCRRAEDFAYRNADLAASLLANAETHMRERGLPPGRFVFVPNGVEPDSRAAPPSPPSEIGAEASRRIAMWRDEGRAVLVHPGGQGPVNALDRLLDAVAVVNGQGLEARLGVILLGHGALTDNLKAQAGRMKLNNVAFFGQVVNAEALWITAQCGIGYAGGHDHRKLYRYGISFNKIMDFMEAGLPVILPLSAEGDPVSASGCGIVTGGTPAAIGRAIAQLVEMEPAERGAVGQRGKEHVARYFSYRHIAADYEAAIRRARNGSC